MSTAPPKLLPIAAPLLVELLLGIAVGVVGTALAARLGDVQAAGFALAHHVFGTLFIVFRIVGAGLGVVVTQALGAARRDTAERVARAALGASSWIGALALLAAALLAEPLLRLIQAPPEVAPPAALLLVAMAPALLLDAWVATGTAVLRAHLHARHTLRTMMAMHGVHLALMPLLMFGAFGPGGLPGLGLAGFAVALLASRVLACGLLAWHWRERLGIVPRPHDFWRLPRAELLAVARIGVPGAAENIAWRLAFVASVAVAGGFGAAALATHAYVYQVMMFVLLVGLATGLAVEIVVGHQVGAGRLRDADRLVRRSLARGLVASVVSALIAALAGPWLLRLFTDDAAIIGQGVLLLWITVLLEPGRTFNLVVINALRATGDARFPVAAGAASMAIVLAGGSWFLGQVLGWGLVGLWIAYAADEWLRGLIMWWRWRRRHWLPHARRSRRRVRAQRLAA